MGLRIAGLAVFSFLLIQTQATPQSTENTASAVPDSEAPAPLTCPAGAPIGAVDLEVRLGATAQPLPLQSIVRLSEGDSVTYSPVIHGKEKRAGEVALVMVPLKRNQHDPLLIVTEPKPAAKQQEWTIPQTITLAAFVYGPSGLSRKKVAGFLSQDDQLMAQLADYAEKTSQTEALLAALSENSSSAGMNAALNGFASQYGLAVQIDKTAPPATQAQTLFATMNPQLATYNPLSSNTTGERVGQTASLATAAATLFFGSPVGLAAGGTAMLLDLRSIAFPNTVFRSSFAQALPTTGVNLCGQRGGVPGHSRVAYIWASRIPNAPLPNITVGTSNFIPQTVRAAVPVEVAEPEWKYLQRARSWFLLNDQGVRTPVDVLKLGNQKSLEIGLDKVNVPPGDYQLNGYWDWTPFRVKGLIHVKLLSDFTNARLEPASQNDLLAHEGKIAVTLVGSDFEFANKVELKKTGDEFAVPEQTKFLLPVGAHKGSQERLDVQIDTTHLDPGPYQLLISQDDGKGRAVPIAILPNPPKIENFPVLLNQGVATQHFVIKGERLQLLAKMEALIADLQLGETSNAGTERNLTVQLKGAPNSGRVDAITAYLSDRAAPLTLPEAIKITGPLPAIASSKLSRPNGMAINLLPDEFPAGYTLTALLDVKNIHPQSVLRLYCAEDVGARPALHLGEQNSRSSLQQLSSDQLFVSDDTSDFPAGCSLLGQIDNGTDGRSQPVELAHLRRFPQVTSFLPVGSAASASPSNNLAQGPPPMRTFELRGLNLEMIERLGWASNTGEMITALPTPIPNMGQQQSLVVSLPEPPSLKSTLYIWLRGESTGRASTITLNVPGAAL